ncbi:hypothetical protein RIF29_23862 [Crotalaria pallida]|uniref:Uncharacterized protein n=1 Tax=Crotalaria pallida TaxID=3830 RepID=A0AAN9EJH9_CROPI
MQNWLAKISWTLLRTEPIYSKHDVIEVGGIEYTCYNVNVITSAVIGDGSCTIGRVANQPKGKGVAEESVQVEVSHVEAKSTIDAAVVSESDNEAMGGDNGAVLRMLGVMKLNETDVHVKIALGILISPFNHLQRLVEVSASLFWRTVCN